MIIVIIIAVLVAVVLLIAAAKPDEFRVERSATINAPAEKIFPLIADFKNWVSWSPYEKLDANMKKTISGAPSGKGAVYEWEGNRKAGKGRMEITEVVPPSKILVQLAFDKPMKASYVADFSLQPSGGATTVAWLMYAPNPFIGKVMGVFVNMDKMIGRDFEVGLANIKAIVER